MSILGKLIPLQHTVDRSTLTVYRSFQEIEVELAWDARWHVVYDKILREVIVANNGAAPSEWIRQEVRRAVQLVIECEKLEHAARVGGDIDPKTYTMLVEQQGLAFSRLGLK
jgi:hypothetical protein